MTWKGTAMYIAMNRFKVQKGSEEAFENVWKGRDSRLHQMKGFKAFHLLRGPVNEAEGYTLFASHSVWAGQEDFIAWTKSENFRAAHRNAGDNKPLYLGHPQFEGFTVVEGA
jgi:heme-degrading monooxygenase HmoA